MNRKGIIKFWVILVAVVGLVSMTFFVWLYAPYFKARLLLSTLDYHYGRRGDGLGPSMTGLHYWHFSMNTFTDDLDVWCIESLYNNTCKHLQQEFGPNSLNTYTYRDQEGWPRQTTVVRLREDTDSASYIAVTALQNNDNDMVRFEHTKGLFDAKNKQWVHSWRLQPHTLR